MGLMKGIFIPDITVEMFRNGCLEAIEALMAEGEIYDIEYDLKSEQPKLSCDECLSSMCQVCIRNPNIKDHFVRGKS